MMQGADTVIYERLAANNPVNNSMKGVTRQHMEEYGAAGLRTLCLAYCELDKAEYDAYVSLLTACRHSFCISACKVD